jgi:hypothetical protein
MLIGILWELDRNRLVNLARDMEGKSILETELLSQLLEGKTGFKDEGAKIQDILQLRFSYSHLMSGLEAARTKLLRTMDHLNEWNEIFRLSGPLTTQTRQEILDTSRGINSSLLEIADEYQSKINTCQTFLEDMSFTIQTVSKLSQPKLDA